MNYEPITLPLPGLEIAGVVWGPEDGQRVIALHGWLDNAASFERLAPLLKGLRIVALDLPGHGLSDHLPAAAHYHFIDWVVSVAGAADALGWETFGLLAHSMGAGIASLVAGTLPERVTHLALIEGLGAMTVKAQEAPIRLAKSIVQRASRARRKPRRHDDRPAAAARLREANPTLSEEAARCIVGRGTKQTDDGGVVWRADPRLRGLSPLRMTEEHVHAFLSRVACPTLLIRAREGYPFDQKLIAGRVACLRNVVVRELAGGHHLHLDDPGPVAEALQPFFAQPGGTEASADGALSSPGVTLEDLTILSGLKILVLDVDGVLTTGLMPWSGEGNTHLAFDVKDGMGITLLRKAGIQVALLSGRETDHVKARAKALGIEHVHLGIKDKVARLTSMLEELDLDLHQVCFMGDDLNDLGVLRAVGYPAAPADARPEVLDAAKFVSSRPGGRGAVRELAEHLLKAQGRWSTVLAGLA